MGAVLQLAGCEIRRRWRSGLVLVLLVGLVGAIVLATAAGARRTSSALARFNSSSRAATVQLNLPNATAAQLHAFGQVPEVASFGVASGMFLQVAAAPNLTLVPEEDTRIGTIVDRPRVLTGRVADPKVVDELAIDESIAARLHLRLGGHLDVSSYSPKQVAIAISGSGDPGPPAGPPVRLRIVGIVRRPFDLGRRGALGGVTILTPAFYRHYSGRIGQFPGATLRVRTRNGLPDLDQIKSAAERIFGASPNLGVTSVATEAGGAQDAINVLTIALWLLAAVAAAAGAVTIGIVLTRQVSLVTFDQETLRALGMTRSQRVAVSAPTALLIAVGGALLAAAGAAASSPFFPIGIARLAEPDPGVRIDWPVLALGTASITVVVLAVAFVAGVRSAQPDALETDAPISRRTAAVAARAGLAPTATNGLRMALEPGHGKAAVPVRSAFLGAVLGVFGVTAVLVFAASLHHLDATPRLYGWTWDFSAPETHSNANSCIRADFGLLKEPGIGAVASVCAGTDNIQLDGRPTSAWSFTSLRGTIEPAIVAGRAPTGPQEVALGSATMHTLHKHIGDLVQASGPHGKRDYQIVGQAVLPSLGQIQPLADGAAFTGPGFAPLFDPNAYNRYLLAQFTPGANRTAIEHWIAANPKLDAASVPSRPVEVDRLRQIDWLPATLAALLTALALIAVSHALVTSVRRRRRELALLKTLGFKRRQVRATIAWQATTLATIGLIVGIPIGLVIGRVAWLLVAHNLGVSNIAVVPTLALLLTVPSALALVNLIAFLPARTAAHTRPGVTLRSE